MVEILEKKTHRFEARSDAKKKNYKGEVNN